MSPTNGKWSCPGSSANFASGMCSCQVAARLDRDDAISRAVDHERRDANRREHVADVDLHRDAEPLARRRGRAREPLSLRVPGLESLVVGERGRDRTRAEAGPSPPLLVPVENPLLRLLVEAPRIVRRPPAPRVRGAEHERRGALGEGGCEQGAHRAALGAAEERSAFRSDRVQHDADVVHELLERAERQNAIGQSGAAAVEDDEPGEGRHPLEERRVGGPPLVLLEVGEVAGGEEEVDRAIAVHLVRDPQVAAPGVARLGFHRASLPE